MEVTYFLIGAAFGMALMGALVVVSFPIIDKLARRSVARDLAAEQAKVRKEFGIE